MLRITELRLPLDHAPDALRDAVVARLGLGREDIRDFHVFRRAWDARRKSAIVLTYTIDVDVVDEDDVLARFSRDRNIGRTPDMTYRMVARAPSSLSRRPIVIGAGPCGLFAMLILSEMGFRPLLLERGKVVRQRTKDTWALWRRSVLDPTSNVQFGEGGAGTFSDGKLYSGIKDPRHLGRKVLEEFVEAGAPEEILYVAKPHIGTFRLVTMVESLRAKIEALGGEYRFQSKVTDIEIETTGDGSRRVTGVKLESGEEIETSCVVLALGHSARDTFEMLSNRGVHIEPKPFSIGVRIEHPQSLIDTCRFGSFAGNKILGAADYKLAHHASNGRSVYSFCMCPGGTVVAAASEVGGVVTNGMSQYSRAERNANAGIVVGISPADYPGSALAGMHFQRRWERLAFELGGGGYRAPAQRVEDFLAGRASTSLGAVVPSYKPGTTPTDLSACLPDYAVTAMREALRAFDRDIPGFSMGDAVMTGVETRTSSPIRITRNEAFQSLNTVGLFPAGEGAGYAGGILSASVDGIRVAEAAARYLVSDRGPVLQAPARPRGHAGLPS
ncbi:MAG TPA: NAD(P)/FAD-dependent oxidoreductase [Hyphomicrobiaceae bacterium]|nr:NAD(P)/FAD-dependent oxidoreductase [Hyphomicrobiaceae bacterium]